MAFQERVYKGFCAIAAEEPNRVKLIDATTTVEEVFADGGAARFAQAHNLVASELERASKQARLRGLAGTVDALERDKAMLSRLKSHGRSPFLQGA